MADLIACGVYIAGLIDPSVRSGSGLPYDLLIDTTTRSIVIADHCKGMWLAIEVLIITIDLASEPTHCLTDDFRMGSLHKDVASLMSATAESRTEQEVIKAVALKTREVVNQLRSTFPSATSTSDFISQVEVSRLTHCYRYHILLTTAMA